MEHRQRAALLPDLRHQTTIAMRRFASNLLGCCGTIIAPVVACTVFAPLAAQEPSWTRGATCYEIFVRSFRDSNGDGIGDLRGLISRLDYINDGNPRTHTDLGAR